MTCGKMLLDCMAISITPCLMGYYIASGFGFLVYLHDDQGYYTVGPASDPTKRLYAQKVQACFDMY